MPNQAVGRGKQLLHWLGGVLDDPVEKLPAGPFATGGAVVGTAIGLVWGFFEAGIGGAIVYAVGGFLIGGIAGFFVSMLIPLVIWGVVRLVGLIVGIGLLYLIVEGIRSLWGVGKP